MTTTEHRLTDIAAIHRYVLGCAQHAEFTLGSVRTGTRFTYRIRRQGDYFFFLDVLTGPNNETDFSFIGSVARTQGAGWRFKFSDKSSLHEGSPAVTAGKWLINRLNRDADLSPEFAEFWYSGRCSICGRTLTVPESLDIGMGPVCFEKAQARLI